MFFNGVWLSLVERTVRDGEVACSNHVAPIDTIFIFASNESSGYTCGMFGYDCLQNIERAKYFYETEKSSYIRGICKNGSNFFEDSPIL